MASISSIPASWQGKIMVAAPDKRVVPVEEVIASKLRFDEFGTGAAIVHKERRNRVLVVEKCFQLDITLDSKTETSTMTQEASKTTSFFKYYAALESVVKYADFGYRLEGNIWYNPNSLEEANFVLSEKEKIAAQIQAVNSCCVIL